MKLTKSTNKNYKGWSIKFFSLTRIVKLALLVFLMSLFGNKIGVAQESKSNVQEKHSLKSGQFYKNVNFIDITISGDEDEKVLLKGGNLLLITPKEDKVLEIVTDISNTIADQTKIPFNINKLKEVSEKQHYLPVVLLLKANKSLEVFFSVSSISEPPGTLWPPNVNEKEGSISISNRYEGSGYIFVIDSSSFSDIYSVTTNRVINSVVLSNIIQQPIHFVSK